MYEKVLEKMVNLKGEKCLDIPKLFTYDDRVTNTLKRISPEFPKPGCYYDYADLIEHMRHALVGMCTCDTDYFLEFLRYDFPEIEKRERRLSESSREIMQLISEDDYNYLQSHLHELRETWEQAMAQYFKRCVLEKK